MSEINIHEKVQTQATFPDFDSLAIQLPKEFIEWQMSARRGAYANVAKGKRPARFSAHLPVVITLKHAAEFITHAATKGTGFTPKGDYLDYYISLFDSCLERCQGRPWKETLGDRIAVAREFYENPDHIDFRRLGLLEIFQGQTYKNLMEDSRITLHYTGEGPDYPSFQINALAQIVGPEDKSFQFIYLARQLFEHDRFHIHQPNYPLGYLVWVQEVFDKSPFHGRAGRQFDKQQVKTPPIEIKEILIPVDNSKYSAYCIDLGLQIAGQFDATITGTHVYAAKLHDDRFKQMEAGLPAKYQKPQELERQRKIHDSLITEGLELISDSYLQALAESSKSANVKFVGKRREGKNYAALIAEIEETDYDLVVMGARGLGEVPGTQLGSVTERVARRSQANLLIVKDEKPIDGKIVVAVDGSPQSFAGVRLAVALAQDTNAKVEAVAAYDPHFHTVAFRGLEGVLTPEVGRVFRFKEQEKLHDEIIDKGIAEIYSDHLETAKTVAAGDGLEITTTLLEGKPFQTILAYIENTQPSLIILGRLGVHADEGLDLGATAENLLRLAPCNVLLAAQKFYPTSEEQDVYIDDFEEIPWTPKALKRFENVPPFARSFARKSIDDYARENGFSEVDVDIMLEARERLGM
jgi:nucleotide-binding universal stress UspA family protein